MPIEQSSRFVCGLPPVSGDFPRLGIDFRAGRDHTGTMTNTTNRRILRSFALTSAAAELDETFAAGLSLGYTLRVWLDPSAAADLAAPDTFHYLTLPAAEDAYRTLEDAALMDESADWLTVRLPAARRTVRREHPAWTGAQVTAEAIRRLG